jgi:hypothetical protein
LAIVRSECLSLFLPAGICSNQAYELALAQVLQATNGTTDFVQQEILWNLFSLYGTLTTP